jgi:hypothetical protein
MKLGFVSAMGLAAGLAAGGVMENPYGTCAHVARDEFGVRGQEYALMQKAGIGWARTDFDWANVQKEKNGPFDFSKFDSVVDDAAKAGVQILPILGYSTHFANPAQEHLDEFAAYIHAVISHFGKRLPVVELWNEENISGFWKDPSAKAYAPLLKRTYETVKAADPSVKLAVGGFAGVPFDYITNLYECGAAKYFDIMNIHPYSHPEIPERDLERRIGMLRSLMAKYGDADKPMWITEIGWPTQPCRLAAPGLIRAGWSIANPGRELGKVLLVMDEDLADHASWKELCSMEFPFADVTIQDGPGGLLDKIRNGAFDLIVLPFNENYPLEAVDALYDYAKAGGTLADFGGMPFWYARVPAKSGGYERKESSATPHLQRFRIGVEASWYDKNRIPETLQAFPTPAVKGLKDFPRKGLAASRFLKPDGLKPGDKFIPLLVGQHNSYTGTVAAVYKYNSDLKGAFIVSAMFENGIRTSSEAKQAKMVTRANLIAFACGVERLFWYEFQAPEYDMRDAESFFGMNHRDLSPKPAYEAYRELIAQRPVGSVQLKGLWHSDDGAFYYPQWKRPDGTIAGALWTPKGETRCVVTFSSPNVKFSKPGGSASLPLVLTDTPFYFSGASVVKIEKCN